jgi:DNA anti-recombination protein RmuC
VAALEPDAAAYAAVKDRTAGMELQAHCRAHAVQEQADQQARQVRRQMEQWLRQVQQEYEQLRSQVESTVSHAADELGKAGKCLDQINQLLGEQEVSLETVAQEYLDSDPDKVPAPVPLKEE